MQAADPAFERTGQQLRCRLPSSLRSSAAAQRERWARRGECSLGLKVARFSSLLFAALALAPGLAHLLELPNKSASLRDDYLTVQQLLSRLAASGFVPSPALCCRRSFL